MSEIPKPMDKPVYYLTNMREVIKESLVKSGIVFGEEPPKGGLSA